LSSGASVNVLALTNNYASTTNPTHCTLSYLLKDSTGQTYSQTSYPIMIDSTGKIYITKNSAFNITVYIIVTSSYSTTSSNSAQTNNF
jgi:hypothetical protein